MSLLPEPVLRWMRAQQLLGIDEVVLDERWKAPSAAPAAKRPGPPAVDRPTNAPPRQPIAPPPVHSTAPSKTMPSFAPPPPTHRTAAPPSQATPRPAPPPARGSIPVFAKLSELVEHANGCSRCILHQRRKGVIATGGPETSSWAILTLYAWGEDAARGGILQGDYGKELLRMAKATGLPDPAAAAIFACTPDDPSDTTIQGFTEAVRCRGHWLQRLKLSGAKAILVLDHKATLLARGPSSPVEWPAFRGRVWDIDGIPAVSTHHPSRLARQPTLGPDVQSDLDQILSLVGGKA